MTERECRHGAVHYGMEQCATHGWICFGSYYESQSSLVYGCLNCHFDEKLASDVANMPTVLRNGVNSPQKACL